MTDNPALLGNEDLLIFDCVADHLQALANISVGAVEDQKIDTTDILHSILTASFHARITQPSNATFS